MMFVCLLSLLVESHSGGKAASKPHAPHPSVTGCPLARLPRSQIHRPSLCWEVWHKGSWLCSAVPRGCLSSSGQGSSQPLDGAVCCPVPSSKSTYAIQGHLKAAGVRQCLVCWTQRGGFQGVNIEHFKCLVWLHQAVCRMWESSKL